MKVCVIIPTFNRAHLVDRAIRSILAQQERARIEILVVDDGSTDDTQAVLADIAARHPEVRTIRQQNGGVTKARNCGLANLRDDVDIVTFLDSDDIWPRNRLEDLDCFTADPSLDLTYGWMILADEIDAVAMAPGAGCRTARVRGLSLSAALFRRNSIESIGRFNEKLPQAEDLDFLLRAFENGLSFVETDTDCVVYLRHQGNMTSSPLDVRRHFMNALYLSTKRRKLNPSLSSRRPAFELSPVTEVELEQPHR